MAQIIFQSKKYNVNEGQDVLTTLLDAGMDIPYGCRSGTCQSCLMKAVQGKLPAESQKGLRDTHKAQSYLLACQCYPQEPLEVALLDVAEIRYKSRILSTQKLSENVIQLFLTRPENFNFHAGQFVNLWKDATLARCYSIANTPDSDVLEFHIREIPQGKFSTWLAQSATKHTQIDIQGPAGSCFYTQDSPDSDLVLIGTGTGLAPLQGILLEAIKTGHGGRVDLFHGALHPQGLYNAELLSDLANTHENVFYHACVIDKGAEVSEKMEYLEGNISDLVFDLFPSMVEKKAYLCGDPGLMKQLKMKVFLAGAKSQDIYVDAFEFA